MAAPVLINVQNIAKAFGERPLFEGLSFAVHDGDRVGLIGPNGAGKSTLMKILAEQEDCDEGECSRRKGLRVGYVPQRPTFEPGLSAEQIVAAAAGSDDHRAAIALSRAGFADPSVPADTLSGGWTTRLAIACALVGEPDLLLLDEPTNHLDVDSILWLESLLGSLATAFVVISHDRYFLQKVATRMIDIDRVYPGGLLAVRGAYAELLEARDTLLSNEADYRESLANRVRREVAWLRRGAKARTSKSRSRIDAAERSISELAESRARAATATTGLELTASGRKTKRLWYGKGLSKRFGDTPLVDDLELLLTPGMRLGVVGAIGSGKSTLLRMIVGELKPDAGEIRKVDDLRTVYFDQHRTAIDPDQTLKRALAPEGDSVIYRDRSVHVVTWAKRFLFSPAQLEQPVSRLSGGERARVTLANLMLQPADLLVLDEPTNDLDIATLEVLEESLMDFPGALVLVSHDRHLVDRVSTGILALDGRGGVQHYADYDQWQAGRSKKRSAKRGKGAAAARAAATRPETGDTAKGNAKGAGDSAGKGKATGKRAGEGEAKSKPKAKRLSYMEQREWDGMEQAVLAAEARLAEVRARAEDPKIATDAVELQKRLDAVAETQGEVDGLYERWSDLESKRR